MDCFSNNSRAGDSAIDSCMNAFIMRCARKFRRVSLWWLLSTIAFSLWEWGTMRKCCGTPTRLRKQSITSLTYWLPLFDSSWLGWPNVLCWINARSVLLAVPLTTALGCVLRLWSLAFLSECIFIWPLCWQHGECLLKRFQLSLTYRTPVPVPVSAEIFTCLLCRVTVVLSGAGGIIFVLWDFEVNFCSTILFIIVHVFSMWSANVWLTVPPNWGF